MKSPSGDDGVIDDEEENDIEDVENKRAFDSVNNFMEHK